MTTSVFRLIHVDCGSNWGADRVLSLLFRPPYNLHTIGILKEETIARGNLLMLSGCLTHNMGPILSNIWRQMNEPFVITIGSEIEACCDTIRHQELAKINPFVLMIPDEILKRRVMHIPGDPPSSDFFAERMKHVEETIRNKNHGSLP